MEEIKKHLPGTFSWVDLAIKAVAKHRKWAQQYYSLQQIYQEPEDFRFYRIPKGRLSLS